MGEGSEVERRGNEAVRKRGRPRKSRAGEVAGSEAGGRERLGAGVTSGVWGRGRLEGRPRRGEREAGARGEAGGRPGSAPCRPARPAGSAPPAWEQSFPSSPGAAAALPCLCFPLSGWKMNFEHRCRACQVIGKHVEHCVWRLRGGPRVGPRPRRPRGGGRGGGQDRGTRGRAPGEGRYTDAEPVPALRELHLASPGKSPTSRPRPQLCPPDCAPPPRAPHLQPHPGLTCQESEKVPAGAGARVPLLKGKPRASHRVSKRRLTAVGPPPEMVS